MSPVNGGRLEVQKIGLRQLVAFPLYGYSAVCVVASFVCPPILVLAAASAAAGKIVEEL